MKDRTYTIRTMNRNDVDMAVEWAAEEGWNPGIHDAGCYFSADPEGFLVGLLGSEPVAAISAVRYGASFGFVGFYIVKPEHRGNGYGIRIWQAGLERLRGRTAGLDGVVAQQSNYQRSGFRLAHRNIRYEGTGSGHLPDPSGIVMLSALPFETVAAYDRPFFPEDRSLFVRSWINQPGCTALGVTLGGKLAGYGVLRQCRTGYKIGPLFADNSDLAESLFLALRAGVSPSEPLFLDVPEVNRESVALAERYGMQISFETARMYSGEKPKMPLDRIFGVTSFEIG